MPSSILSVSVPQLPDSQRSGILVTMTTVPPFKFKDRGHYTKRGEPKRTLTFIEARQLCADNPALNMYNCVVCGQLHVGNPKKAS
jgi:DNA-directed RNA polymerase subunit M/transcription elongation factor TFIIS